jgi:hypothetical protein
MERLTDADPDGRAAYWRTYYEEGSSVRHEDDDLDPEHRCDRLLNTSLSAAQRVVVAGATIKPGDHVICAGLPLEVICPARNSLFFYGYYAPWFGDMPVPIDGSYLTEVARLDPADENTPIWLEVTP